MIAVGCVEAVDDADTALEDGDTALEDDEIVLDDGDIALEDEDIALEEDSAPIEEEAAKAEEEEALDWMAGDTSLEVLVETASEVDEVSWLNDLTEEGRTDDVGQ